MSAASSQHDPGLMGRAIRAVGWGYGGTVARMALQIGAQAVLARLLGPQEFGVFAALMLLAAVAVIAGDWVSAPVIQVKALDEATLAFALGCQVVGSLIMSLVVMASLPVYQYLFPGAKGLGLAVTLMSLGCLVTGLGGLSLSLLRRQLRYRDIQLAQVAGYFVGYGLVAIPLAWWGPRSFMVLVLAWGAQALVTAMLLYRAASHTVRPSFDARPHSAFLRFGLQITAGNLGNWFAGSCDRILVARVAAAGDIGLYNTMLNLIMTPVTQIAATLNTVAFSVSAQAASEARRRGAVAYISLTALTSAWLYALIATFPESIVAMIYGAGWEKGAELVPAFCGVAVGFSVGAAASSILTSGGKGSAVALVQLLAGLSVFLAVFIGLKFSLLAAAQALSLVYVVRALVLVFVAMRAVGASAPRVVAVLLVPMIMASFQVMLSRSAAIALDWRSPLAHILLAVFVSSIALLAMAYFRNLFLVPEVRWLISSLKSRRTAGVI